jgi:hypothetical protein
LTETARRTPVPKASTWTLWQCSYQMGRPMLIGEMLEAAVPHRGHAAGWQARQKALPQEQQGA